MLSMLTKVNSNRERHGAMRGYCAGKRCVGQCRQLRGDSDHYASAYQSKLQEGFTNTLLRNVSDRESLMPRMRLLEPLWPSAMQH